MQRRRVVVTLVAVLLAAFSAVALAKGTKIKKPAPTRATAASPVVEVKTSMGSFQIELYPDKAPKTVENFLKYVDDKFYDGTIFHRVIADFMIQGGGFDPKMNKKATRDPIANEAKGAMSNLRGTVAMARTSDPNSATAQFFVNVKDNKRLDWSDSPGGDGYCAFGKVISGMDVVDKIKAVPTSSQGGMGDVPTTPVLIESVRRVK
jgi:peptidyl-prolyl cis-trans isomerase A (cyclophilin A)